VIVNLQRFIEAERPYWQELEGLLARQGASARLTFDEVRRLYYLYQRASSDLGEVTTFAADRDLQGYLEGLVGQAYCEIHESRSHHRFRPLRWLLVTLPCTWRRHYRAWLLSLAVTLGGVAFGGAALTFDSRARDALIPAAAHLRLDPSARVRQEEARAGGLPEFGLAGSGWYFQHNTTVSLVALAMGFTWGVGTILALFYNGVILGVVVADYVLAGEGLFVAGWLLPHGAVEIPAILIAGQAGLVLASALIGWGRRAPLLQRLRETAPDVVTLIGGVALMMFWAGLVESWFSQLHAPVVPYWFKVVVGIVELAAVVAFYAFAGRTAAAADEPEEPA
jgi:uncharacterized membrane protein SpoIIM required for sporulation